MPSLADTATRHWTKAESVMSTRRAKRRRDFVTGEQLLSAVERVVDDSDSLIARVETLKSAALYQDDLENLSSQIIAEYSTRAAIAGGATALPGLLPGLGSAVALVGGALVDMTLALKHDVEMILCLTHLHGFDIRDERERWLAYVMAGVRTHAAEHRQNYLVDLMEIQLDALPKYTPRQLFKLATTVLGKAALQSLSRSYVKALPIVGIAISASTNKFLTTSVGWACVDALERRLGVVSEADDPAVDAVLS